MNILVTGGSGTVGRYIVDELIEHGHAVTVMDLVPPVRPGIPFVRADVLRLDEVVPAVKGRDAVVHTAGIPHPLNDPPEKVFTVNVNGTFNVLEASARAGVGKVVFTSSESTLGFAFMTKRMTPLYAPVDERHPTRPQDAYGLSKVVCEQLCASYTLRYGMRTVCLREPWIWVPDAAMLPMYRKLVDEYESWPKNLWAYVHGYDAAQAHRLAVEKNLERLHEVFFITARENWTGRDSRELLARYYPETTEFRNGFSGAQSVISSAKARTLLGYEPRYSAKDLFAS
jgi:nucleoside-diphosphate-sugar epimerase